MTSGTDRGTTGFNGLVDARHGRLIYNRFDQYVGRSVETYGEFSELELQFLLSGVAEGDVVVEVGANIGSHTVALAAKVGSSGRVLAFEAQRIVHQALCGNLALNSIANAMAYHAALGDTEGQLSVPAVDYARPANFGGISVRPAGEGEPVPAWRLDGMGQLPRLKLMKIDVEGMEAAVIRGAADTIARLKPALYVENDRVEKSAELIELITSLGYRCYWHRPPLFNPDNFFRVADNIFPNLISVNMLCLHESRPAVDGLREVTGTDYHPLAK